MTSLSASAGSSNDADATPIPPNVRRQAAEWLVELQSDSVTDELRQRWQHWRAAHPDHERAWQRVESFSSRLRGLPSPLAHATLAAPASPRRRQVIKTLSLLLFAGGTAWVVGERSVSRHWSADRRTGTGERSSLVLPDGTRVELNARTALDIRFTASERTLRLLGGEILIVTAHEPTAGSRTVSSRPFLVETAHGRIHALGTRFIVRDFAEDRAGSSRVAVFEGAVEIRPARADGAARVLRAGEQGRFTSSASEATGIAREEDTAWTEGMIVAQDMSLGDFLTELGRHRPGYLECDPDVAHLKVSGTYPLADTDRVLEMLGATLPVRVRFFTRYWVKIQPAG